MACEDAQQGGFTRAVLSDDADERAGAIAKLTPLASL
jgi:hypothetical protein